MIRIENLDSIINNTWTSNHMKQKQELANQFVNFNDDYYLSESNLKEDEEYYLAELYSIKKFAESLDESNLDQKLKDKLNTINSCISTLNSKHNNIYDDFIEKNKPRTLETKSITSDHINTIKKNYHKKTKLEEIDFLIKDWISSVAYLGKKKTNKDYKKYLNNIKSQYADINSLLNYLKKEEDLQKHELEELVEKEKNTEKIMREVLYNVKYKKLPHQKLSLIAKIIAGIAIAVTLYEAGEIIHIGSKKFDDWINKDEINYEEKSPYDSYRDYGLLDIKDYNFS